MMKQILFIAIMAVCSAVTAVQASDVVKSDVFDYNSCIGVKDNQEYITIYLTGNDEWYVAHNVYDGEHTIRINGAWDWPKNPMPTPREALLSVRVDKRRIIDSHAVDDCIENKEITKWVIILKPAQ
jgi:hypothetical protein